MIAFRFTPPFCLQSFGDRRKLLPYQRLLPVQIVRAVVVGDFYGVEMLIPIFEFGQFFLPFLDVILQFRLRSRRRHKRQLFFGTGYIGLKLINLHLPGISGIRPSNTFHLRHIRTPTIRLRTFPLAHVAVVELLKIRTTAVEYAVFTKILKRSVHLLTFSQSSRILVLTAVKSLLNGAYNLCQRVTISLS
ncbi:hypothetical protein EVA_06140 [gut metagenome]|uniref:Uncharacterized protein n=1 Tax=gut metagenome TaxID=749906 RepID=J9GY63_9ZZZZ